MNRMIYVYEYKNAYLTVLYLMENNIHIRLCTLTCCHLTGSKIKLIKMLTV